MQDRVSLTIRDGVADVRLTRADKMNALDDAMFDALLAVIDRLARARAVRCVVLSGEGRAFCAGLDVARFGQMADAQATTALAPRTHGMANRPQQLAWGWRELPMPVIAAVHGVAFGGGLQIMLGADIRIVHPETRLSIREGKWGLVPDMGATVLMQGLVREDVMRELTYTARIFSGEQAHALGFATHVSRTCHGDAMNLAHEITKKNPDAVRAAKQLFNNVPDSSVAEALIAESKAQDRLTGSDNQTEAVRAELASRNPEFAD